MMRHGMSGEAQDKSARITAAEDAKALELAMTMNRKKKKKTGLRT